MKILDNKEGVGSIKIVVVFLFMLVAIIDTSSIYSAINTNNSFDGKYISDISVNSVDELQFQDFDDIEINEPSLEIELWMIDFNYLNNAIEKNRANKSKKREYEIDEGVLFEKIAG